MDHISKIKAIDILADAALHRMNEIHDVICSNVSNVNSDLESYINKIWFNKESKLFQIYSLANSEVKKRILDCLGIGDFNDVIKRYITFCNGSSPIVLKDVSADAWQTVEKEGVDLYGDETSWSQFWILATEKGKMEFLDYIERDHMENASTLPF